MRVFPKSLLEGKVTIGLNMAWKVAPVTYGITIGPHLNIPEFMPDEPARPEIIWITRADKARAVLSGEQFAYADRSFFNFEMADRAPFHTDDWVSDAGRVIDYVRRPTGIKLYQWSSISQTAANLAANLGAKNVVLVGCDNTSLLGNHHAHQQHTKWLGEDPDYRYGQYYEGLAEVRAALRPRGVNLVSLSPFLKLDDPAGEFLRLCREMEQPEFLVGEDISERDHPRRFATRPQPAGNARRVVRQLRSLSRRALRSNRPA